MTLKERKIMLLDFQIMCVILFFEVNWKKYMNNRVFETPNKQICLCCQEVIDLLLKFKSAGNSAKGLPISTAAATSM